MAAWDQNTARTSLRTLLADNDGDKFEFKVPVYPVPDGLTRVFALGRQRVLAGTVAVYVDAAPIAPSGVVVDEAPGTAELPNAPGAAAQVLASFGYQWFTDAQLHAFLLGADQMLGFDDEASVTPVALRPVVLDFAMYHAYMHQAQQAAEELVVSAGGYTAHQSRSHPNWLALAKMSFERGQAKLKIYVDSTLTARTPALEFTTYSLPRWQGL